MIFYILRKQQLFFGKYRYIHFKNNYNDTIGQCDDLIMDSVNTVVTESSTYITPPKVNNLVKLDEYTMFELDSFTKCSIFKRPKDECLYEKNTHFGWMICGENKTVLYIRDY